MSFLYKILRKIFGENISLQYKIARKFYYISFTESRPKPMIIASMDGRTFTNGFADRLRGIISCYAYSKIKGIPFRIDHIEPFYLYDFFEPNEYDWLLKDKERVNNLLFSNPIVLRNHTKGLRFLHLNDKRQHHFYSNIDTLTLFNKTFGTTFSYSQLFHELFQPTRYLLENVKVYDKYIREGYISISFRFMQLMGDFCDCKGETLSDEEKLNLIKKCHSFIEKVHTENKWANNILVTSDSQYFMDSLSVIQYVFTIPGKIGHIGFESSKEAHLKTFVDFYMISQAQKVYMGYTGKMYNSHFAASAAASTGKEYQAIFF